MNIFINFIPTIFVEVIQTFHLGVPKLNHLEVMTKITKQIAESYLSPKNILKHISVLVYKVMMVHLLNRIV